MKRIPLLAILILCSLGAGQRKTTWVALGDSITYLNDHLDETGNRLTKGYMTQFTEKFPDVQYINQGHNGWTAISIAEKIETLGILQKKIQGDLQKRSEDYYTGKRAMEAISPEKTITKQELGHGTTEKVQTEKILGAFRASTW